MALLCDIDIQNLRVVARNSFWTLEDGNDASCQSNSLLFGRCRSWSDSFMAHEAWEPRETNALETTSLGGSVADGDASDFGVLETSVCWSVLGCHTQAATQPNRQAATQAKHT